MSAYFERLKDPRWQRMRLEIMQRDDFACVSCGDTESTLNVHHGYYAKDTEPWEYPEESMWTLCRACHKKAEPYRLMLRRLAGSIPPKHQHAALMLLVYVVGEDMNPDAFQSLAVDVAYDEDAVWDLGESFSNEQLNSQARGLYLDMSALISGEIEGE